MRRAVLAIAATVTGLVLLLGFKAHPLSAAPAPVVAQSAPQSTGPTPDSGSTSPGSTAAPAPQATPPSQSSQTRTVTGDAVDTRFGPVQVRVTVAGSRITGIKTLQVPMQDARDQEINSYAVPVLTQEAMAAQSAQIDVVSGATYTSDGYAQSLQSALDQAGL